DQERHEESLKQLKEALFAQGYCNPCIESRITPLASQKSVAVILKINLGKRFRIGTVNLLWKGADEKAAEYLDELKRALASGFYEKLQGRKYSKILLNKETQQLK